MKETAISVGSALTLQLGAVTQEEFFNPILFAICTSTFGARGSVVVKALCYKPEGRGFDSR
jgi:hypothetical protein